MSDVTHALVVLDDRVDRAVVETLVTSDARLAVSEFVDLDGHDPSEDGAGDIVLVACAEYNATVGDYIRMATRLHPARPLVLLSARPANGHLSEVISAGAEDVVVIPVDSDTHTVKAASGQVVFAVDKALARYRSDSSASARRLASMICVLGLKGGSGKTLTAANTAVALAEAGASVAMVDLDLQFGDVGLTLGMHPERTVYDLVRAGGSLDREKLESFLTVHKSGVRALLAPTVPDEAGAVTPAVLQEIYPLLRQMHDYVIVDTPPSFTPEVIGAVDASSDVCVVAMLDSPSLKNTKLGLETLKRMNYPGRVRLVLNRADSSVGISPDDAIAVLGRTPDVFVPSDRAITSAVNQGEPIVSLKRHSQAAHAFQALARLYLDDEIGTQVKPPQARKRLLGRRGR
jgi:pilus assembly protein CpaE